MGQSPSTSPSTRSSTRRPRAAWLNRTRGWLLAAGMAAAGAVAAAGAQAPAHPDLTGVWMAPTGVHPAGFPMQAGITPWQAASAGDPRKQHIPTMAEAMKRGDAQNAALQGSKGDPNSINLGPPRGPPVAMTAAGQAVRNRFDPKVYEDQDLNCYPFNVLSRVGGGLGPLQIVASPKVLMMATEINGDNYPRIIWLDGRTDKDALPSWEGFSVAHWVGKTLHVETTKIKGGYFNQSWPLSGSARLVEDYTIVGAGKSRKLEVLQTVIDPENYQEPMRRVSYLDWRPDELLQDFPCEEGKGDQAETQINASKP